MTLNRTELEYEIAGNGEPVVTIHGVIIGDSFRPLLEHPSFVEKRRVVLYHRRGYGQSRYPEGDVSIEMQAADCIELIRRIGFERVHIVGHSYGGAIGIQVALDAPELVQTLALLEPAIMAGASVESYRDSLRDGQKRYSESGPATAINDFLAMRFGAGYRSHLDQILPGWFDQALVDARTSFEVELPALEDWQFTELDAQRIKIPVLNVVGSESEKLSPRFRETDKTLLQWLPHAESLTLEKAAHGLQMQNTDGMASALLDFLKRYPIKG